MAWGLRAASDEYRREVFGAFAWAHVWQRPKTRIVLSDELDGPFAEMFASLYGVTPLRVTVAHPYGRSDPRGPGKESTLITYQRDADGRTVTVKTRPPAQVASIVGLDESPTALARHALACRARLERELERGYGEINTSTLPASDTFRAERELLPVRTGEHAQRRLDWERATSLAPVWTSRPPVWTGLTG
jgi:hypothetical protein